MGSGKTTFGKKLASKLDLPFIDSDLEISMNENKSINELFAEDGEDYFRDLESTFIQNLMKSDQDFVLSTGGGLPCFKDNMEVLNQLGTTIYLEMSPQALLKRLENGLDDRPLLKDLTENELLTYISQKLEERTPYYQKAKIIFPGINAKKGSEIDSLINRLNS